MKKLISFLMIISIVLSLCACGSEKKTDSSQSAKPSASESATEKSTEEAQDDLSAPGENNKSEAIIGGADEPTEIEIETITPSEKSDNTKKVYWATKDKEPSDVYYHKTDCEMIKDKDPEVLPWEIIEAIGMTPCETCNP